MQKDVLRNFTKFTGKHLRKILFLKKVAGLWASTLFKKATLAQVLSCEISKNIFLHRTPLVTASKTKNFCGWILSFLTAKNTCQVSLRRIHSQNKYQRNIIFRSSRPKVFLRKCSENMQQTDSRAPMPKHQCTNTNTLLKSHFGMGVLK